MALSQHTVDETNKQEDFLSPLVEEYGEAEFEFDEYEEELANPKPEQEAPVPGPVPIEFDPLAALLSRVNQKLADDGKLKESRKALTDSRVVGAKREELEQAVRKIELTRDWKARATVALYQTQVCAHCESINSLFTGLFQREVHKTNRSTRWVQVATVQSNLPKETKETKSTTSMCFDCATEDFGFFLREGPDNMPVPTPAPAPTPAQPDENAETLQPLSDNWKNHMATKPGLYANINAKKDRIKDGSGEKMRKPGTKGAPSKSDFKQSAKTAKKK